MPPHGDFALDTTQDFLVKTLRRGSEVYNNVSYFRTKVLGCSFQNYIPDTTIL